MDIWREWGRPEYQEWLSSAIRLVKKKGGRPRKAWFIGIRKAMEKKWKEKESLLEKFHKPVLEPVCFKLDMMYFLLILVLFDTGLRDNTGL